MTVRPAVSFSRPAIGIVSQPGGGRVPVTHIYGRLEDGGTFLVRDDRQRPHFYIRSSRRRACPKRCEVRRHRRSISGHSPANPWFASRPNRRPMCRQCATAACRRHRHVRSGRALCDALPDRARHQGWMRDRRAEHARQRCYVGVRQSSAASRADITIAPRVLSFDIETDPQGRAPAGHLAVRPDIDEVLIVDGSGRAMPEKAVALRERIRRARAVLRARQGRSIRMC